MASKQRILVIEDDAAIRRGLVDVLQMAGYGTLEAADGPTGLESALAGEIVEPPAINGPHSGE